jgi:replication factor A1
MELHLGSRSEIIVNPEGETVGDVKIKVSAPNAVRKEIANLREGDEAELFGTVVQLFEPNFYFVCPECMRKAFPQGDKYVCNEHGEVEAKKMPVFNLYFDDGTANLRAVVFAQQSNDLIGGEYNGNFEDVKNGVLGKQVILIGRVVKNQMFDRLEFVVRNVKEADPVEMIQKI